MDKYSVYVGMDVHARSLTAQALIKETGEIRKKRFGAGYTAAEIADWIESLGGSALAAYESGCTGIWLARDLRLLGIACDVIAISTLARSTKDRQEKCDKLDARAILREMANPLSTYSCVFVPTEKQEGERDLCRLYVQARDAAKQAKQNLSSFLLRHGHVWNEKTRTGRPKKPSGRAYEAWLSSISFSDAATRSAFGILRRRKESAQAELLQARRAVEALAEKAEHAPYVEALRRLKGIDTLNAMIVRAEFCDFGRFRSGRKVSCWMGSAPSNSSSGERDAHGPITKAGNKYLRRALVEGVAGISGWKARPKPSEAGEGPHGEAERMSRRANIRLHERFVHLRRDLGKHPNKAKVAIANELVRWCWAIGREVDRSLAREDG